MGSRRPLRSFFYPCLTLAALILARPLPALTITEVFYNPGAAASAEEDLEFIEIFNDAPTVVDLSGAYFSDGIDFVFPVGTFLKARSALAVCANATAVKARFPRGNVIGDFQGKLDNGGETVRLVTVSGSPLAEVSYKDRGLWPASTDGTGFSLSLKDPRANSEDPLNWVRSGSPGGTPGEENFPPPTLADNLIFPDTGPDSVWKYRKGYNETTLTPEDFSVPTGAWRALAFDDSSWPQGETPIGYNETEIATVLADMDNHYISFALRKKFQLTQAQLDELVSATLSFRLDDGCVVYLNGVELGRFGLTGAAGTDVPFDAAATLARELKAAKPLVLSISRAQLVAGENLLAVQVHNRRLTEATGDAGFAGMLAYQTTVIHAKAPTPTVVLNEVVSRAPAGQRVVELFNTLESPLDLSDYSISLDPERKTTYKLPASTVIAPRSFFQVAEATLGFKLEGEQLSLFLHEADGMTVADAATLEDPTVLPAEPQSHVRYPDGDPKWWVALHPTPGAENQVEVEKDLVLNEIHYKPKLLIASGQSDPNAAKGELVEIFNRSARTIALDGYRLSSGFNYAFAAGSSIGPQGYLVVARDPQFIRDTYGLSAEQVVGPSATATPEELLSFGSLKNQGERIRLEDRWDNVVDEVSYRSQGEWPELADGGGSTLELIDPFQDNASPLAWEASDERAKAPWTEITFESKHVATLPPLPMESELHIFFLSEGEMLIDGVSLTQGDPPVELIPNGDFEQNTAPWRLAGTHVHSVRTTDEAKVGSASLHVIATGSGDNRVNRIELDTAPALKAGPVKFKMWARWLSGSNAVHISGYNNAFGTTVWLPVPPNAGSPGRENGRRARLREETGSDNLGPVISRVMHEPAVPGNLEPIHVRATVTDSDGVASVEALYQKDGAAAFDRVPLLDDGAHDDGAAGDGVFAGDIPGFPSKSLVNYMIEAKDSGGRTRSFPRLAPDETLLFAVDDRMVSTVSRYRLLINARSLNTPVTGLARRLLHSDELVRGTFIFDESEVYYNIGLRYHGSPWNRPPDPKMFRIRFNDDKPFTDGAKRINISRYGSVMNEATSYHLIEQAAIPNVSVPHSQRYTFMNMKLNTNPHGSGALSEIRPVDSHYIHFNWPNDDAGQAYKITGKLAFSDTGQMAGGGPDWTQLKTYTTGPYPGTHSPENYRFYFNPTVDVDDDLFESIIELMKSMDRTTTPDAEYDEKIADILNVEASLRVFAVRSLLADWDTVDIGNGQNAYIYYAPIEGRHYLVPWDMDHTFERSDVIIIPTTGTTGFRRLIGRPVYRRQYARILQELLDSSWSAAYLTSWMNLMNETTGPGRVAPGTSLLAFLNGRRTSVSTFLRSGVNIPFAVTTPNPVGFPSTTAAIQGTAGIEVASIFATVNGGEPVELEVAWSTPPRQNTAIPTIWATSVADLKLEKNTVEIIAFDREGNVAGSKTMEIHNTTGWEAPFVGTLAPPAGPLEGGTNIAIRGSGFRDGALVTVGGKPATEVTLLTSQEIRVTTPAGTAEGPVDVVVVNIDQQQSTLVGGFTYGTGAPPFLRGDADRNGSINQTDVISILTYLFRSGDLVCLDAADVNDDGKLNVSDPIRLLLHLFQGGASPPEPYAAPGSDPTADGLDCRG